MREVPNVARILLLEDNLDLLNMTTEVLEMAGHEVLRGRSGCEGLALLEAGPLPPDLILTDLMMPEMGGDDFLRRIRGDGRWMHIPVVVVSGIADDRGHALEHGADDFLVKPFRQGELFQVMSQFVPE
jgi:CheY-like chemotaxis protein